jgi:hypothetical protein
VACSEFMRFGDSVRMDPGREMDLSSSVQSINGWSEHSDGAAHRGGLPPAYSFAVSAVSAVLTKVRRSLARSLQVHVAYRESMTRTEFAKLPKNREKAKMRRRTGLLAVLFGCLGIPTASAVPVTVSMSGTVVTSAYSEQFFGTASDTVDFHISFAADTDTATRITAGTPIVASGSSFASDAFLFGHAALSDFSATVGNETFLATDLLPQGLGSTAYSYTMLLLESAEEGLFRAAFLFLRPDGAMLRIGPPVCFAGGFGACIIYTGNAFDANGIGGPVVSFQSSVTPAEVSVPEPSPAALILCGLVGMLALRRRVI